MNPITQQVDILNEPGPSLPQARFLIAFRIFALVIALGGALLAASGRIAGYGIDFDQYYLGGLLARESKWESLYPVPIPGVALNAGYPEASNLKPDALSRATKTGASTAWHFAGPPPLALAFSPLTVLPLVQARVIWFVILAIALWGAALLSGLIFRLLVGRATEAEGLIVCASVLLPRTLFSIRIGNISSIVALSLAVSMIGILTNRPLLAGSFNAIGVLSKYAPGVALPVALLRKQFRLVIAAFAGIACLIILTWFFSGTSVFIEFFTKIAPTMAFPTMDRSNQAIWGIIGGFHLAPVMQTRAVIATKVFQWVAFILICGLLIRPRSIITSVSGTIAATLLLLCWLQIFGPITWGHYAVYFIPFTGWIYFHARRTWTTMIYLIITSILVFIPWNAVPGPQLIHDALTFYSLFCGMVLLAIFACYALWSPRLPGWPPR